MNTYISKNLRRARENANYRQVDVMRETSINNKSLSNWENGIAYPCLDDLITLADLYKISLDELIGHKTKADRELSLDEISLITNYRKLNDKGKTDLLSIVESFSCNPVYTEKISSFAG